MRAVVAITLGQTPVWRFGHWAARYAAPNDLFFDCDNFSDDSVLGNAARLCAEATELLFVVEALHPQAQGALPKILELLVKHRNKAQLYFCGTHHMQPKLAAIYAQKFEIVSADS